MRAIQEFVFGYGSLICPYSRAMTVPTLNGKIATPVVVKHVERVWSKKIPGKMTAMGVRFVDHAECAGILLPVDGTELSQFDKRERGYDRVPLYLGDVQPYVLPHVNNNNNNDASKKNEVNPEQKAGNIHEAFLDAKEAKAEHSNVKIWMYLPQKYAPPSEEAPIVQSYVDTIMRGCLTISDDFTLQFLTKTKGWTPGSEMELSDDSDDDDDDSSSMEDANIGSADNSESTSNVHWLDDRHNPIYVRGDQQYMLQHGQILDSILEKHRGEFQYRSKCSPDMDFH